MVPQLTRAHKAFYRLISHDYARRCWKLISGSDSKIKNLPTFFKLILINRVLVVRLSKPNYSLNTFLNTFIFIILPHIGITESKIAL